jgi:hypothetical protein
MKERIYILLLLAFPLITLGQDNVPIDNKKAKDNNAAHAAELKKAEKDRARQDNKFSGHKKHIKLTKPNKDDKEDKQQKKEQKKAL